MDDCDTYAESESTGSMVFFAGEGTNADMIATVHGAFVSGIRAANEAFDSLQPAEEVPAEEAPAEEALEEA